MRPPSLPPSIARLNDFSRAICFLRLLLSSVFSPTTWELRGKKSLSLTTHFSPPLKLFCSIFSVIVQEGTAAAGTASALTVAYLSDSPWQHHYSFVWYLANDGDHDARSLCFRRWQRMLRST